MFASKIFQLRSKSGQLLLHEICSYLRDIFSQQSILILKTIEVKIKLINTHTNKLTAEWKKKSKRTLAAAAVCKPPIPGRRLISGTINSLTEASTKKPNLTNLSIQLPLVSSSFGKGHPHFFKFLITYK